MIKEDLKIGFIGAGNMASALISGLIQSNHSASCIMASSPEQEHLNNLSKNFDIKTTNNNVEIVNFADAVLLAVKPNICLLYTSPSPRDTERSRMPSSA